MNRVLLSWCVTVGMGLVGCSQPANTHGAATEGVEEATGVGGAAAPASGASPEVAPVALAEGEQAFGAPLVGDRVAVALSAPSGSQKFDEAALEAVRRGLVDRPPTPPPAPAASAAERRPMQSRWRVRAGYAVTLPRAVPPMTPRAANARMPVHGVPLPVPLWGTFDESRGTVREGRAFTDKLEVEVRLMSLQPAPPLPPSP